MKVAVTGANGFVGTYLVKLLAKSNTEINILSRRKSNNFNEQVNVFYGSLTSVDCNLELFLTDCDVVYHCAGEIRDQSLMEELHINGTQRLITAVENESKRRGKKIHFVQLSSVGVYGPPLTRPSEDRVITEGSPMNPIGVYEITKARADQLLIEAGHNNLFTYSILRPSNIFGIGMKSNSLIAMGSMIKKRIFFYIGKPKSTATYVHVSDVATALVLCSLNSRAKGEIYNLSNDCFLEELIESMAYELKVKKPILRIPETLIRIVSSLLNAFIRTPLTKERINSLVSRTSYPYSKIANNLGFKPEKPVLESIGTIFKKHS